MAEEKRLEHLVTIAVAIFLANVSPTTQLRKLVCSDTELPMIIFSESKRLATMMQGKVSIKNLQSWFLTDLLYFHVQCIQSVLNDCTQAVVIHNRSG